MFKQFFCTFNIISQCLNNNLTKNYYLPILFNQNYYYR